MSSLSLLIYNGDDLPEKCVHIFSELPSGYTFYKKPELAESNFCGHDLKSYKKHGQCWADPKSCSYLYSPFQKVRIIFKSIHKKGYKQNKN